MCQQAQGCAGACRCLVWIGGAGTVSRGLSLALTYLACRQAGLYLASALPAALRNQGSHSHLRASCEFPGKAREKQGGPRVTLAIGQR